MSSPLTGCVTLGKLLKLLVLQFLGHRTGKVSFHSNPKERSNYHTIALISHASKVML